MNSTGPADCPVAEPRAGSAVARWLLGAVICPLGFAVVVVGFGLAMELSDAQTVARSALAAGVASASTMLALARGDRYRWWLAATSGATAFIATCFLWLLAYAAAVAWAWNAMYD